MKTHLPIDLKNKSLNLKSKRDFCLKNRYLYAAFYFHIQIMEFYTHLPSQYQREEDINDFHQISKIIVQDCFGNSDEKLFDCIYYDVAVGLGYETDLQNFPNDEYMIRTFCMHINIIDFLYSTKSPAFEAEIKPYIENLMNAYRKKYGNDGVIYLKLCLHIIFESVWPSNYEYSLELFNAHLERFVKYLADYEFTYTVFLGYAGGYIELEEFEKANKLITITEKSLKKIDDLQQQNVKLHCAFLKARILGLQGNYTESEKHCHYALRFINDEHPIFPEICWVMMVNRSYAGKDYSEWVEKGLASCKALNYTDSQAYYRLLSGLASLEYHKGNIANAIHYAKEVLTGYEMIFGKESKMHIAAVVDYFNYLDDEKVKQNFYDDILDSIHDFKDPNVKAFAYNALSGASYNEHGEMTLNTSELEKVAREAVKSSDATTTQHLKILSRINLLNLLVRQKAKYNQFQLEIEELFTLLEANKNKMNNILRYSFDVCYIIYYCNHNLPQRAYETVKKLKKTISTISESLELLRDFDKVYIEVLLVNKKRDEAMQYIGITINEIEQTLHQANNLTIVTDYLSFVLSVISQYGKSSDCYSELSYKCALMLKYINLKLHPDFERNNTNIDISRQISALELRKINIDAFKDDDEINSTLKALRYKINYSQDKKYRMPQLEDIHLVDSSVLLDICLFFEYRHGDFTSIRDSDEMVLSLKYAVFAIFIDQDGQQQVTRLKDIDMNIIENILHTTEEFYSTSELRYLYDLFFGPCKQYFYGNDTLYLSLDHNLPVIPFGALLDLYKRPLIDKCNVINVLTATDICPDFHVTLDDALLMGNPQYSIDEKYANVVEDLPYTEVEINLIDNMIPTTHKYLNAEAKKDNFYKNVESNIIHISSHGIFNDFNADELNTPLIESSIFLSGCVDFVYNDKKDGYGNGLLTAQDVISLELQKTNLVVLSTCESGAGYDDSSTSVLKGLRWALGFTGAKASVTSVYEVNDIATAIFMVLFYRNLKTLPVAKALNEAKKKMRNLYVKDIKLDAELHAAFGNEFKGWFIYSKPFKDMEYWCVFDCYFYGGVL